MPIDPDSSVWQGVRQAARNGDPSSRRLALRMMAEHEAYEALVAAEMDETAASLDLDSSDLRRQADGAASVSPALAIAAERAKLA